MLLVYINNHTAVWGSWYSPNSGQWGYACCHSIIHASYCAGLAGIEATNSGSAANLLASANASTSSETNSQAKSLLEAHQEKPEKGEFKNGKNKDREQKFGQSKWKLGEGDLQLDEKRLADALQAEKKRKAQDGDDESGWGKKKKYNSALTGGDQSFEVTEEELGTYMIQWCGGFVLTLDNRGIQEDSTRGYGGPNVQLQGR